VTASDAVHDARIFHVNINCSDLERSRRFFADALGLDAATRTTPETAQDGTAFGLERARWDAWVLVGASNFAGGAVDLLEWHEPAPIGAPPTSLLETGFQRIGVAVPDLDAVAARVAACGGALWSEPASHTLEGGGGVRLVMANDPDATTVELIEADGPRLIFVAVGCRDLERSTRFYHRLGFHEVARFPSAGDDGERLRIEGPFAMDEVMLAAPGGGEVHLVLAGFRRPRPVTAPARPANALGMWRTAMLVADLDAACAHLDDIGVATLSKPVTMAMGPGLPELRFVCFAGPDHEVLELIELPQ
jgi:catechol 2,3-dioxygenase-like lactoylglutathione lyase family enzyme